MLIYELNFFASTRARVLKVQTEGLTHKIDLSLRPSLGGEADPPAPRPKPSDDFPLVPASLALPSLAPGNPLGGFVKHASAKGIFVAVARGVDARIQLSHLSDVQLEDPVAKFPPGTEFSIYFLLFFDAEFFFSPFYHYLYVVFTADLLTYDLDLQERIN